MCFPHLMYCLYSVKVSVDVFPSLDALLVFSQGAGQGIRRCVLFT